MIEWVCVEGSRLVERTTYGFTSGRCGPHTHTRNSDFADDFLHRFDTTIRDQFWFFFIPSQGQHFLKTPLVEEESPPPKCVLVERFSSPIEVHGYFSDRNFLVACSFEASFFCRKGTSASNHHGLLVASCRKGFFFSKEPG